MKYHHYKALRWFRYTIFFGFAINMVFVLPALFAPKFLETLSDFGRTNTPYWLQNTGLLLGIVTVMYIPAIRDPFRYLFISVLLVAGRFSAALLFVTGVLFMNFPDGMLILGVADLGLSSLQAILLFFTLRAGDPRGGY